MAGSQSRRPISHGTPHGVEEVKAEIKAEIKAAKDQGFEEWILWNAGVKYTVGALGPG